MFFLLAVVHPRRFDDLFLKSIMPGVIYHGDFSSYSTTNPCPIFLPRAMEYTPFFFALKIVFIGIFVSPASE